jgi:cytochrome c oxidase cbb3-type subunit 3
MSEIRRYDEITNEPVLDHDYDGIEELDNPLPGWWLATFYLCVIFAGGYFLWFQILNDGNNIRHTYNQEWQAMEAKAMEADAAAAASMSDDLFAKQVNDPAVVTAGKAVYESKCSSCHAPDGGGLIGPNLTDNHWLHGDGKPMAVFKVIKDGVMAKGMPAWGPVLSKEELSQVSAFVVSLKGTKPAAPKEAQGDAY